MILTAISPRLAMRTRPNGGGSPALSLRKDATAGAPASAGSERDVAMLLSGVRLPLVRQDRQRSDESRAGLRWFDHFVDVPAGRGDIRTRELGFVRGDQPGSLRDGIIGGRD